MRSRLVGRSKHLRPDYLHDSSTHEISKRNLPMWVRNARELKWWDPVREYIHVATHYITHMTSHTTDIMRITTHFPFDTGSYEEMTLFTCVKLNLQLS